MWNIGEVDMVNLLLHPVRIRIVHAFASGRALTITELGEHLADVPKTTLYRHVGTLAAAGLLEVTGEQRVHGAVERTYRLDRARTRIGPPSAAVKTVDDHRKGFTVAMATLLADFNAYLDRPNTQPSNDMVEYLQIPLWLSRAEVTSLVEQLHEMLAAKFDNVAEPGRQLYLLSPVLFPIDQT